MPFKISFDRLINGTISVLKRFPLTAFFCLVWTISCIILIEEQYSSKSSEWVLYMKLIMSSFVGALCSIVATILYESYDRLAKYKWLILGFSFIFAVVYYFGIPSDLNEFSYKPIFIFISWVLILLLAITASPFLKNPSNLQFWDFNRSNLFLIIEAAFYGFILFGGISLALLALDLLFSVEFDAKLYGQIFCVIAGLFFSFYILAEFPKLPYYQLENQAYSRVYKVFSLYILIPLVLIYFIILYAFGIKLMFSEWPDGLVSSLILWFLIVGLLTYLFNSNISRDTSQLSYYFKKYFFYSLLPLSILLFLAVYRRINEYQFTELRIVLSFVAFWLFGISIYFIVSKSKKLKVIPISLLITGILLLYFPINIFNVSAKSQLSRFVQLAEDAGMIQNNTLQARGDSTEDNKVREMWQTLEYLDSRKELGRLKGFLPASVSPLDNGMFSLKDISDYLNIDAKDLRNLDSETQYFSSTLPSSIILENYEYLLPVSLVPSDFTGDELYIEVNVKEEKLELYSDGEITDKFDISLIISNLYINNNINYNTGYEYFPVESDQFLGKLFIKELQYLPDSRENRIILFEALLLLDLK